MIPRYSRPQMAAIWAPENASSHLVRDRGACLRRDGGRRIIPKPCQGHLGRRGQGDGGAEEATRRANVEKIDAIERVTKHDVIAFLTWLGEFIAPNRASCTRACSSDVLDTSFAVQLTQAADLLLADVDRLLAALKKRAPSSTRTRSPSAAATAFMPSRRPSASNLRAIYAGSSATASGWSRPAPRYATCAISGPVGTFANVDPGIEAHVARSSASPSSRSRLRSSRATAMPPSSRPWASSPRRSVNLATEIRHFAAHRGARCGGFFSAGQKGSSVDAAQAQSGADGERHRLSPACAVGGRAGAGERNAVARARHLALLHRRYIARRTPPVRSISR